MDILLNQMERLEPPGTVADIGPTTGRDRDGVMEVRIDSARRILAVRVHDIGKVRRPERFVQCALKAFEAADGERALRSLARTGQDAAWLARADAAVAGREPLRMPTPPDVSYEAFQDGRLAAGAAHRPARPAPGTSDNGYLTIQRGRSGGIDAIHVDAAWLSGASAQYLEAAFVQAAAFTPEGR
jgi:hypothetical protein